MTLLFYKIMPPCRNIEISADVCEMGGGKDTNPHKQDWMEIPVNEVVNLDTAQLLRAAIRLVEAMSNVCVPKLHDREQGCSFRELCNHHFPSFYGTGGYPRAKNWLNDIEEILETTGCTEE